MQVELFKKISKYKNKDGEEKIATNFYIKCGNEVVPVEIKYFEGQNGKDFLSVFDKMFEVALLFDDKNITAQN